MNSVHRIAYLIRQSGLRQLNNSEQEELNCWLQNTDNRELYEQLSEPTKEAEKIMHLQQYDSRKAFQAFRRKTDTRVHRLWVYSRRAACFMVPLALGVYLWTAQPATNSIPTEPTISHLLPGETKAILTLSGGQKIELGALTGGQTIQEGGSEIRIDSSTMKYTSSKENEESKMNILYVPRKGEYTMLLEDGTRVFLNADSRLTYPVVFAGKSREVTLEGEAFFDVAHDAERPFIVKSGNIRIAVLGTEFNLKTYADEENIVTTLAKGKVAVSDGKEQIIIHPGEQICYSKESGKMSKQEVDVTLYTSWKEGLFKFKREKLENILTTLSRWYDVTIFYENASVKELIFSGDLKRYASIDEHLKMLEMTTNLRFTINNDVVFVK